MINRSRRVGNTPYWSFATFEIGYSFIQSGCAHPGIKTAVGFEPRFNCCSWLSYLCVPRTICEKDWLAGFGSTGSWDTRVLWESVQSVCLSDACPSYICFSRNFWVKLETAKQIIFCGCLTVNICIIIRRNDVNVQRKLSVQFTLLTKTLWEHYLNNILVSEQPFWMCVCNALSSHDQTEYSTCISKWGKKHNNFFS